MTADPVTSSEMQAPRRAAGGVVWRRGARGVEVVVVHRPRYDDWSLPKGKVDPGETDEEAARREVQEEAGVRTLLGPELAGTTYVDRNGRDKVVRYWAMTVSAGTVGGDNEVDRAEWLPLPDARDRLTYERDHAVLDRAAELLAPVAALAPVALDHVVIICADVDASIAWWAGVLGAERVRVDEWRAGAAPFPSVRINAETIVDLLPGVATGNNMEHVCVVMEGFDPQRVVDSGSFEVLVGPVRRFGARGEATSVYVRAPEGTMVELRTYNR